MNAAHPPGEAPRRPPRAENSPRVADGRTSRPVWPAAAALAGLALLIGAVFLPVLGFGFTHYDEDSQLLNNRLVRSLDRENLHRIFSQPSSTSYYPVRLLSFAVDYAFWGYEPRGYHLTNTAIHLVNVWLLFLLIRRLLSRDSGERTRATPTAALAFVAAVIFAVHPVVVEPVAWIAGREELLMVLFALSCLHAHLSGRTTAGGMRHPRLKRAVWFGASVLFYLLACLCNAAAAGFAAVMLAAELTLPPRRRIRSALVTSSPFLLLASATIVLKKLTDHAADPQDLPLQTLGLFSLNRVLTALELYALNLGTLAWPKALAVLYPNHVPVTALQPTVIAGAVLIIVTAVLLIHWGSHPVVSFGLLMFLLALAPSSQIVPHYVFRADRFLYLPLAGAAVAIAGAGRWAAACFVRCHRAILAVLACLCLVLAIRSRVQLMVWRDPLTLFDHCVRVHPHPMAYCNRGSALLARGRLEEALADFDRAVRGNPDVPEAHYNRGLAFERLQQWDRAIEDYTQAAQRRPTYAEAYNNRGNVRFRLGDHEAAIEDYTRAIEARADYAEAFHNRGCAHLARGGHLAAIEDFSRSLQFNPGDADTLYSRALVFGRLGRAVEAVRDLTACILAAPSSAGAYLERGRQHNRMGDVQEARRDWQEAMRLDPAGDVGAAAADLLERTP